MLPRFLKRHLTALADFYERDSQYDRAHGQLRRAAGTMRLAIWIRPTRERYLWLAEMLDALGDLVGAEKAIGHAVRIYGDEATYEALFIYGVAKSKLGKVDEATELIRRALAVKPDAPVGIYALGSLYASRGDFAMANEMFLKDAPVTTGNGAPTYTRALQFSREDVEAELKRKSVYSLQDADQKARADHFLGIFRAEMARKDAEYIRGLAGLPAKRAG